MQTEIDPAVHQRRWLILGILCLSLVLVVAAVSSVNVAIPSIRSQLAPSDTQLLWIVDIYAVVFAGLLLPAGALGDRFGRKGALQIGLAVFAVGSLLSSQAGSANALIAFRVLMGIGAALIMPSTLSLLTSVFPPAERPKAIAVWAGFAGAGAVIGTLVGGLVLEHFWWGAVFFVSVPIAALSMVLVAALCPTSREERIRPLDPLGALASVVGFGALLYAIIEGPEKGWTSVHALGAGALALVGLAGFVWWERRTPHPMLDVRFFAIPHFGIGAAAITGAFFCMFGNFFLIAQYFQSVRGYSPFESGLATLPYAATMIAFSSRGPGLANRFGPRRSVGVGLAVAAAGLVQLSLTTESSPYLQVAIGLVTMALGTSVSMATLSGGVVLSLPLDQAGVGSAVNDTTREVGGAVGIAVLGSILSTTYRNGIKDSLAALPDGTEQVAETARRGIGPLRALVEQAPGNEQLAPLVSDLQQLLDDASGAFVNGMQVGLRVAAVVMAAVALLVWRRYPNEAIRAKGH